MSRQIICPACGGEFHGNEDHKCAAINGGWVPPLEHETKLREMAAEQAEANYRASTEQ